MALPTYIPNYRYELEIDDADIRIHARPFDPRWAIDHRPGEIHIEIEQDDGDDENRVTINCRNQHEALELIEALRLAASDAFGIPHREDTAAIQLKLGTTAEDDARQAREYVRFQEAVPLLRAKMNAALDRLKAVEVAADRLHQATLHAIHNTTDPTVGYGLTNEIARYDYVRRDLGSFSYADPTEATQL